MEIQITEKEPCSLSVRYTAGAKEIAEKEREVIKLFKNAPTPPGSRSGKANDDQIRMHYRQQINEATKRSLSENAFHQTLFEKSLRPHGPPKFTSTVLLANHFSCEFDMYVKPNFELADLKTLEVVRPHLDNNSENDEVQKTLQELRVKYGEASPYQEEDVVEVGDNIIASFQGTVDGEDLAHLKGEQEMITVGQSGLKDFDDQMLGMKSGEVKEFDFIAPSDGLASLAGKQVHFKVEVMTGSKVVPAPLDDSLAVKLGQENFIKLQEYVRTVCASRIQQKNTGALNDAISKVLLASHTFDVPNFFTVSEARYLAASAKLDFDTLPQEDKDQYMKHAEEFVKLSLINDLIRENYVETQMTDEECLNTIRQTLVKTQGNENVEETLQQMQKTGQLNIIVARLKDTYLLDALHEIMQIKE